MLPVFLSFCLHVGEANSFSKLPSLGRRKDEKLFLGVRLRAARGLGVINDLCKNVFMFGERIFLLRR